MHDEFFTATNPRPIGVNNIYEGWVSPFHSFEMPSPILALDDLIKTHKSYNFSALTLYGGAIYDQYLERRPKDYDVYVCSPKFVEDIEQLLAAPRTSYRDMHDENDKMASLVSMFGLQEDDGVTSLRRIKLQNKFDNISISGDFYHQGDIFKMDIRVGRLPLTASYISSITASPAVSAVVQVADEGLKFAYHQDTMAHLQSRILISKNPRDEEQLAYLSVLAKKKGFQLIKDWGSNSTPSLGV